MGNRTERLREAQSQLDARPRPDPPMTRAGEGREAEDVPVMAWSRGADVLCLLLLLGLAIGGCSLIKSGMIKVGAGCLVVAALILVALIAHAATSGRRFGRPR